jgi:hypothetical protein
VTDSRDYFRIFLDSIGKMAKKDLVSFIPEVDLDPGVLGKVDLFALLDEVGILGLCRGDSDFSDLASMVQAVSRLSEYCAGIGAFASYCLAAERFLALAGMECPARAPALCLFDDEELDLSSRRLSFKALLTEGKLTGRKKSVVLGGYGGPYAVCAREGDDPVLCLIGHDDATVAVEEIGILGAKALRLADISFSNATPVSVRPLTRDALLGLFSHLSLLLGACACATSAKSLDIAREYARERYQGGSMIEEYDAIKLMIEGNRATLSAASSAILDASSRFDRENGKGAAPCLRAKAAASAASVNAGLDAIQVHGGYGYMRDYGVEKRFRDASTLSVLPLDGTRLLLIGSALAD